MAGVSSNGSPELRSRPSAQFLIHDESDDKLDTSVALRQANSVSSQTRLWHIIDFCVDLSLDIQSQLQAGLCFYRGVDTFVDLKARESTGSTSFSQWPEGQSRIHVADIWFCADNGQS